MFHTGKKTWNVNGEIKHSEKDKTQAETQNDQNWTFIHFKVTF